MIIAFTPSQFNREGSYQGETEVRASVQPARILKNCGVQDTGYSIVYYLVLEKFKRGVQR